MELTEEDEKFLTDIGESIAYIADGYYGNGADIVEQIRDYLKGIRGERSCQ